MVKKICHWHCPYSVLRWAHTQPIRIISRYAKNLMNTLYKKAEENAKTRKIVSVKFILWLVSLCMEIIITESRALQLTETVIITNHSQTICNIRIKRYTMQTMYLSVHKTNLGRNFVRSETSLLCDCFTQLVATDLSSLGQRSGTEAEMFGPNAFRVTSTTKSFSMPHQRLSSAKKCMLISTWFVAAKLQLESTNRLEAGVTANKQEVTLKRFYGFLWWFDQCAIPGNHFLIELDFWPLKNTQWISFELDQIDNNGYY